MGLAEMSSLDLLEQVRIASPCSANWEEMRGDERARFCELCQKHVYNFAAMTADEAAGLICEKEGKLCARLYRRRDGTVLTADCPVGAARYWKRAKAAAAAMVVTGLFAAGTALSASLDRSSRTWPQQTQGRVSAKVDRAIWQVKEWLGLNPQPVVMGSIAMPAPASGQCGVGDVKVPAQQ
jgi:hypothetical protein